MLQWGRAAVLAGLAALGVVGGSVQAADYAVTYTSMPIEGIGAGVFTGTLTTTDTADANGYYTVTGITGFRNGLKVSLVPAGSNYRNNNLFRPTDSYIDESGIVFSDGVTTYAVYRDSGYYFEYSGLGSFNYIDTFTAVALPGAAAVPETATWAMMIIGMGMVGGVLRRRVRASEIEFDAKIKRIAAGEAA